MDGMFFQHENGQQLGQRPPEPGIGKLLLITIAAAFVVVGLLLLLRWAGADVTMPNEFPILAASN